jgi:carboxyl-terminal processing protease
MGFPASVRGPGVNMAFPDSCKTPPSMAPVVYMNVGQHILAKMESKVVYFGGMPALNIGCFIMPTTADSPGVGGGIKSGTVMGPGFFDQGSPIVYVEKLPAVRLTSLISGNNDNAKGLVTTPGVVHVLLAYDSGASTALDRDALDTLARNIERAPEPPAMLVAPGVGYVRIERFAADTPRVFFNAQAALVREGAAAFVLDLRGCPGGDLEAAYQLAGEFLPRGALLGRVIDADGDKTPRIAPREGPYRYPLVLLVDATTRSAAEAFTGALAHHGRARVVGGATFGKTSVQAVVQDDDGGGALVDRARFELP